MLLRTLVNRFGTMHRWSALLSMVGSATLLIVCSVAPNSVFAQRTGRRKPAVSHATAATKPLEILGLRPGIGLDSVKTVLNEAGVEIREVREDSVSRAFMAPGVRIFVVDSIICRLTYMRMSFLFEGAQLQLRRLTITPRESAMASGQTDDVNSVLLLYFGEQWGKPEINFDPPACFRWRTGNIEAKGFIRRGYPIWTLEG